MKTSENKNKNKNIHFKFWTNWSGCKNSFSPKTGKSSFTNNFIIKKSFLEQLTFENKGGNPEDDFGFKNTPEKD
jgi:hypothetical protein